MKLSFFYQNFSINIIFLFLFFYQEWLLIAILLDHKEVLIQVSLNCF